MKLQASKSLLGDRNGLIMEAAKSFARMFVGMNK
jgi:hypothetical protein